MADDDEWLERLRAARNAGQSPREHRLLDELRTAIRHKNEATEVRHDGARELERLFFRLRSERLLDVPSRAAWKRTMPLSAVALVVAGFAVTMIWRSGLFSSENGNEAPVMRGSDALQIISVADPDAAAQEVVARMQMLGIAVERYSVGTSVGLTTTIPAADIERARSALAPLNVALPANGKLRLEYRKAAR